ncbi:DUF6153 family protein [Nocardia aurantiaca]|uniref:Uncharacterized protein n=1 Tax=Nocardia aurantiaca TaxID=2675850 RepID=A0A6I3L678_9NOCA|nr:DUF6153 family protein [Nocardia aurantiaca]MTE15369.1 hypothetical protein [Nocardia aurantiaca]
MIVRQSPGTRFVRAFGLLALLAGLVAMHALALGMSHEGLGHEVPLSTSAVMIDHHHAAMPVMGIAPVAVAAAMGEDHGMSTPGCGGDCGDGHAGMHGCLFVLAALLFGLGLALLGWVGLGRRDAAPVKVRHPRANHARSPPWTVLSLAELAILRI